MGVSEKLNNTYYKAKVAIPYWKLLQVPVRVSHHQLNLSSQSRLPDCHHARFPCVFLSALLPLPHQDPKDNARLKH